MLQRKPPALVVRYQSYSSLKVHRLTGLSHLNWAEWLAMPTFPPSFHTSELTQVIESRGEETVVWSAVARFRGVVFPLCLDLCIFRACQKLCCRELWARFLKDPWELSSSDWFHQRRPPGEWEDVSFTEAGFREENWHLHLMEQCFRWGWFPISGIISASHLKKLESSFLSKGCL